MKNKYILTLIFSFLSLPLAHALDAVVIVLEAPLLKEPSMHSQVMQRIRKGERVYVPSEAIENEAMPEFIPTFDRAGNKVFVPSRYIKIVTKDDREYNQPITIAGSDPTDYRIEEPIPETYPFANTYFARASLSMFVGNNTQSSYAFSPSYDQQKINNEIGGRIVVSKKTDFDAYDRIYFGLFTSLSNAENSAQFKDQTESTENQALFRIGPILTYDIYKSKSMRFTFGGGFTYNYHKNLVQVEGLELSEERVFSGYSFSPLLTTTFQFQSMIPNTDFIAGADVSAFLPYSLKSDSEAEFPELWNESNEINSDFKLQASLFFGLQVSY